MYAENPDCPFCGVRMILPEDIGFDLRRDGRGEMRQFIKAELDNMCTIEHIYSKLNPLRNSPEIKDMPKYMICCKKCNNARGRAEEAALGIEVLRQRSTRGEVTGAGFEPAFLGPKPKVITIILSGNET
jgi:hypothetical protein